jgi:hypothetical protein
MTAALVLLPPRSDELVTEAPQAADTFSCSADGDAWACGLPAGSSHSDDRCRDIVPEVIIELL